jgi:tRNA modification GTPase
LIASDSSASHELAIQQMRGGFSDEIQALRERLIKFASLIELELDFGEEDVEFANRDDLRELVIQIKKVIYDLVLSFQLGNVIKNGVSTVIAGRPNAGKSTLLNALLNEERAIVSSIAGTTRDTIEEVLNIQGVQFRLIDTAGIREATDTIEAIGVEKTMEKIQKSTLLMYVFDVENLPIAEAKADLERLVHESITPVVIANKIDLVENPDLKKKIHEELKDFPILLVSAAQRENIQGVKDFLHRVVMTGEISMDNTIVSNLRHYEALEKAHQSLADVLSGLDMGITGDFLAQDIRHALMHLGEITGEISTDDLLDSIFRDFCIGK